MAVNISFGQIIANRFRVDALIASGGMGTVFRVWDLQRNVPLAMKVLHAELADDADVQECFRREARALGKLVHPNIIPFYGHYQTRNHNLFLQLYIDGPSLKEVLMQRGNPLPVRDTLSIMRSLCSAVGYSHNNDVIHCDIKPGNVMIDRGGKVYLGDFGIARHAESDLTALPGAGTAAFMAPEQITGKIVTRQTDIYSLGVLLFELLTGKRPFVGNEAGTEKAGNQITERIRYAHVYIQPPDPRQYNPNISPQLSSIILRALEKNPANRFSSSQELFNALCWALNTNPDQVPDRVSADLVAIKTPVSPNPQPTPKTNPVPAKKPHLFIGIAVVVVAALLFFAMRGFGAGPRSGSLFPGEYSTATSVIETPPQKQTTLIQSPAEAQPTDAASLNEPTATRIPSTATRIAPTNTPASEFPTYKPLSNCPSSHLRVGDSAYVTYNGVKISLRSQPVGRIGDTLIRKLEEGEVVHIIDGPVCDLGLLLWKVRTVQDEYGWLPEGEDYDFWILPVPAEKGCGNLPARLWIGATAFVEPMPVDRNILWSEPTRNSVELGRMNPGSYMQVLEGPSCGNGSEGVWWYVYSEQLRKEGWTRESSLSHDYYFIAPVIPRP